MSKHLAHYIVIVFVFMILAGRAGGAAPGRAEFEIPFDFIVRNQVFPAGKYRLGQLNPANPDILVLKRADGRKNILLLAQRVGAEKRIDQSFLSFRRGASGNYLSGIRRAGEEYGYRIYVPGRESSTGLEAEVIYPNGN